MTIKEIDMRELRAMKGKGGFILQGCGGELQEWVDGINNQLTEKEILLEGSKFEDCYTFKNGNLTCLLFPFGEQEIDMGKMLIWRALASSNMGCMWLSDFVDSHLGGFTEHNQAIKPDCPLIGADGNIFNLMGITSRTLKQHGMQEQAKEMTERIQKSGSYAEALNIIGEYVNITSVDDEIEEVEEGVMMQQ